MNVKKIYSLIKEKGQRVTRQKQTILMVLSNNMDRMLSVHDIKEHIPQDQHMDIVTIYRNVQSFTGLGILDSMIDDRGVTRYVLDNEHQHHHYLVCIVCGRITNFPCHNHYWISYARENGFQELYHKLEVYGKCVRCQSDS